MKYIFIILSLFLLINISAKEIESLKEPTKVVAELIKKYDLEEVDFDYVKSSIGSGSRNSAKSILIDARPEIKYQKGTIPSSLNIPDTKFDEYYSVLNGVSKDKELIVYCGGYNCTKSAIVANKLKEKGHLNVKVYSAGEPQWNTLSYLEIDLSVIKSLHSKNLALLVDARPYQKFLQETILGSISIPDTNIDKLIGRFPINKNENIIVFCGGYNCEKSHNIANKLISLGYKNISVFAGGLPVWKEKGLNTTAYVTVKIDKKEELKKEDFSKNGLKKGSDEGSVDGEWLKKLIQDKNIPSYIQIVDVTSESEFSNGHINGAINIEAAKFNAKDFFEKLPKNKTIVFNCTAGGRSIEAWSKLNDEKFDMSEIYYLDANISCKDNDCKIDVNEPLL
uniref:rhodanese-like domain-containing protein n=1 Tax=Aliarcobacter sp. TaxID=2321116 RepID=UPI004048572F